MNLGNRLNLILSLVPENSRLADIGTDHGYIPVYCVKNGKCISAIAMDINEKPLLSADKNIKKYGFSHVITTRLSNGLENLKKDEANVIVIAGMGGLLIMDIIENGMEVISDDTLLILQPMLAVKELREYLYSHGFNVENEYVCREDNKFYNILTVRKGKANPSPTDIVIGKNISENTPCDYKEYLEYKLRVLHKIAAGMKKSACCDDGELKKVMNDIEIFEKEREAMI